MKPLTDLERAKEELLSCHELKCVLKKGSTTYQSQKRGVAPMLDFLEQKLELSGFSAADRVVGKATAYLFVLAGVTAVWSDVMSEAAQAVLNRYGIPCTAIKIVPYIINRSGDGACPMETAVQTITEPALAYAAIKETQERLLKAKRN